MRDVRVCIWRPLTASSIPHTGSGGPKVDTCPMKHDKSIKSIRNKNSK
jgi:hypothetical protein